MDSCDLTSSLSLGHGGEGQGEGECDRLPNKKELHSKQIPLLSEHRDSRILEPGIPLVADDQTAWHLNPQYQCVAPHPTQ